MYPFFLESILGDKLYIPSYGVMLAFAFTMSYLDALRQAMKPGLELRHIENLFLWIVISSFIGSRAFHVIFEDGAYFMAHPKEIFAFWQGGFTFYGALICAITASVTYVYFKKVSERWYADAATPPIYLGLFLGRIGCFLAGCCWGQPTTMPWGVTFTHPLSFASPKGVPLHPTQLYESFFVLLGYIYLNRLSNHRRYPGQIAAYGLMIYPVIRFIVEFFRGDSYRGFVAGGLSTSQFISIWLFALGVFLHIVLSAYNQKHPETNKVLIRGGKASAKGH